MSKAKTKPRAKIKPKTKAKAKKKGDNKRGKAIKEFLSEASEFVESVSQHLMEIDSSIRHGEPDPDMVNEVFRGWHTLKGLASTFGVESLSRLSHQEENLLDDIRLGRVELTPTVLDTLFESVEAVSKILAVINSTGDLASADSMEEEINTARISTSATVPPPVESDPQVPRGDVQPGDLVAQEVLEVLTEFEEHRLQTNLQQGRALYKVCASFPLVSIDTDLEEIKRRLKPVGEVITYLPSMENTDPDKLDIDVLISLRESVDELHEVLDGLKVKLEMLVPANAAPAAPSPTVIPPPPSEGDLDEQRRPTVIPAPREDAYEMMEGKTTLTPPKEEEKSQAISLRSVSQSVRVDIGKLDTLMNSVGELNITRSAIAKLGEQLRAVEGRRDLAIELHRIIRGFERRLEEMREGILEFRMVPVSQLFDRLSRTTRKVSRSVGKEIHFMVSGAETEVDKLIIEELSDPLMHIIRNSIDHGIESPGERIASGKPEMGTVALTAYQKGNHILIEVEDDGGGIDLERILEVTVERGVITQEQVESLSEREILSLIFLPGVTSASTATEISGRGVGMDVVKTNISALGGLIEVQSEMGIGTKFTITMPVTLAIIPALQVEVDNRTYSIPLNTVAEAFTISQPDIRKVLGAETMTLRGHTLPLCRLDAFYGTPRSGPIPDNSRVIVTALGSRRLGLIVDKIFDQHPVIIKPLGASLAEVDCFSGVTDIGEKKLSLVLDTVKVLEEFFASGDDMVQAAVE